MLPETTLSCTRAKGAVVVEDVARSAMAPATQLLEQLQNVSASLASGWGLWQLEVDSTCGLKVCDVCDADSLIVLAEVACAIVASQAWATASVMVPNKQKATATTR